MEYIYFQCRKDLLWTLQALRVRKAHSFRCGSFRKLFKDSEEGVKVDENFIKLLTEEQKNAIIEALDNELERKE